MESVPDGRDPGRDLASVRYPGAGQHQADRQVVATAKEEDDQEVAHHNFKVNQENCAMKPMRYHQKH